MHADCFTEILREHGFKCIGELNYRLQLALWWHPSNERRVEVLILQLGGSAILRAAKSYFMKSVTSEGESWVRDLPALHQYLEDHFPEMRISFSHFRDVPAELAELEARRRMAV